MVASGLSYSMRDLVPWSWMKPGPLHWKRGVLATSPPGKLQYLFLEQRKNKNIDYNYLRTKELWLISRGPYCIPWDALQFSSVAQSCPTLCKPMNHSTADLPVHHQLLELAQTHVHWVSDAIQSSYPLSSPSPPAFNLPQHQGLSQWVSSSHQVAKGLKLKLQHQSCQWIVRTDFL